jgi:hypothetical protein
MANTGPTERIEDVDESEDEALAHTEEIVQGIHTAEEDTREAKEIEYSDKRSAMSVTNQAAGQQSTLPRNVREHIKGFANKLYTVKPGKIGMKNQRVLFRYNKDSE